MKIEKLNKDNIKEFIKDMKLDNTGNLEYNVDKCEFYGIKKDGTFYIGFDLLSFVDTIAILQYNPKLSNELFYECIDFLNRNLVVKNHLIISVYDDKYMKLLDDKYKCKEVFITLNLNGDINEKKGNINDKYVVREKFIDIEMKSIKYNYSNDMVICNLLKQNIHDERILIALHEHFKNLNVNSINFFIYSDCYECFKTLGYNIVCKSYVIRNDLF
ncbi:MAG: hypothetical protein IJZ46_00860 [Bacilli bacterium]|nr:hypothetical protein [Bacilli bacterium]